MCKKVQPFKRLFSLKKQNAQEYIGMLFIVICMKIFKELNMLVKIMKNFVENKSFEITHHPSMLHLHDLISQEHYLKFLSS